MQTLHVMEGNLNFILGFSIFSIVRLLCHLILLCLAILA